MVKALVNLTEHENRVLTIVKGRHGFRNKTDAIRFLIRRYESEVLSPSLRPVYDVGEREDLEARRRGWERFSEFERDRLRGKATDPTENLRVFERLLDIYYRKRGWDEQGIPPERLEKQFSQQD